MNHQMRYVYLELLRGCAALLVLLEHVELLFESKLNVPIKDINGALTGNRLAADGWATRTAHYLGSLSYSIYLTHFLGLMVGVVVLQKPLGSRLESALLLVPTIIVTIGGLIVLAHLASRYIELPLSAAMKRALSDKRARGSPGSAGETVRRNLEGP